MLQKFAQFKFAGAELPPRTIIARISDETVDRNGDIVIAAGCKYDDFTRNPIVLWQHDPNRPIARAALSRGAGFIDAVITFPPEGVSADADGAYGLVKADIVRGVSIGFRAIDYEPMRGGGAKFTAWELLEISIVSVPSNTNALVSQKAAPTVAAGLAARLKDCFAKSERAHIFALDAHDAYSLGDCGAAEALDEMRRAVTEARSYVNAARAFVNSGAQAPESPSDADQELALGARRNRMAQVLDATDVGAVAPTAAIAPETRGGAYLAAALRTADQLRLRRIWGW